jgi:predicted enzyme related to lactoylglutathione lyase
MADPLSTHAHHTFDYIEIPTLDIDASERFYAAALGWRFEPYGPAYRAIVTPDGREGGGLSLVGEVQPGGALVVLFSRNLTESRDAVRAAGGTIIRDIFDFPGGQRFHFTDPSGIELGVWGFAPDHAN